ncbi:MAG: polysaccharide biosynthesis tyrosine autokinase [Planctomycetales bacterium]|nr:polysaccharide biosynthesis tyrosine autokinase [Planctomycetales bacterium]
MPPSLVETDPLAPLAELGPGVAASTPGRPEQNLLALAWQSRWLVLLFMILGGTAGWLLLQRAVPRYTSGSKIYVERNLPQILDSSLSVGQSASYLFTQAEIIRSTSVLAAAVESPEIAQLETIRNAVRTGENPLALLREALMVSVGANDEIITVALELPNAEDASRLVNAIVAAYIDKYAADRKSSAVDILTILRAEKQRRQTDLEGRRTDLETFRNDHPELAVKVRSGSIVSDRFSTLTGELNSTEIQLLEAKALYNRVKGMYDSPAQRPLLADMARENSEGIEEQSLLALQNQVQGVELQIAAEQAHWGDGHPRVKLLMKSLAMWQERLDAKKAELAEDRATMTAAYVDSVKQQYELLEHKYAELQRSYDRQFSEAKEVSAQMLQLASLQEALERSEKENDDINEQIKKVNLTEEVGAMNVSIMEVAAPAAEPSYPDRKRFLAAGSMLGALIGFGLGWLRNLLDHRLKSADEISEALQLPILGALPLAPGVKNHIEAGLMLVNAPRAAFSEAIRTLRTSFHFGLGGPDVRVICITSPSPGDGKSTVASNFAVALAQSGQNTLLIDADMRKPRQHGIFGAAKDSGLSTVLSDRRPASAIIQATGIEHLSLLPCGPVPSNPVELLNNGFFGDLITQLSEHFDRIVIDSPPVMPVADARVIAAMSDATLLVLRAERATRRLSQAARNELWQVRAKRLGVVVNGVPLRGPSGYGYGYGYGAGYGGYSYGGYGDPSADDAPLPSERRKKSRPRLGAEPIAAGPQD